MTAPVQTPNPGTSTRPEQSSRRIAHKSPLGWLPWALLGLLALLVALVLLAVNALDDDGPAGPGGDSLGQAGPADSDGSTSTGAGTGSTGGSGTSGAALRAGSSDLLALPGGDLTGVAGAAASGTAVVQSVVSDEGFWVGPSSSNRVFVFLTPAARRASGESPFQVKAGQRVSLTGTVVPLAQAGSDTSGVTESEGRDLLTREGGVLEAKTAALAG